MSAYRHVWNGNGLSYLTEAERKNLDKQGLVGDMRMTSSGALQVDGDGNLWVSTRDGAKLVGHGELVPDAPDAPKN